MANNQITLLSFSNPITMVTFPTSLPIIDSSWLLDSGASHHVTNDLSSLSLYTPYNGHEELIIDDGTSLQITHIGSMFLALSNYNVNLSNILYVPKIFRNILSLSRLCLDNNLQISFYSNSFIIKVLSTNQIILKHQTNQGVYTCSLFSPVVYSISPPNVPHLLGIIVLVIYLQRCLIPFRVFLNVSPSTSSFTPPCNYCQINKSHKLPFYNSTLTSNAPLDLIFLMFGLLLFYLMIILNIASFLLYPIKYKSDSLKVFFSDFNLSLKNTLIDQLNKFSVIMVMNMLN